MGLRVCAEPGCPTLGSKTRCKAHERAKEAARGTRQARGYDAEHDALRADYQRQMNAGETFFCWRCKAVLDPAHWTLGHCDRDRTRYHGPECPRCDYATAGRLRDACPHPSHTPGGGA